MYSLIIKFDQNSLFIKAVLKIKPIGLGLGLYSLIYSRKVEGNITGFRLTS